MTINIAVVTSDALVLGCDSIASLTRHLLDPFEFEFTRRDDGKLSLEFEISDLLPHVSSAWGNVTKMFPLQTANACVAAVTCGVARLNDRTMSSLAAEFMEIQHARQKPRVNVEAIANDFFKFLTKEYKKNYEDSSVPEELWDGPEFLVGGYGKNDHMPSLYRINIQNKDVRCEYTTGTYGIAWAGQSDAVVRLIRGVDAPLKHRINREIEKAVDEIYDGTSGDVARIVQEIIDKAGLKSIPKGINTKLSKRIEVKLDWDSEQLGFPVRSWPTQDAVDFAAFLVNMQSARSKFVPGVATVGGRTHVGVISKERGFVMLNEPELRHRNIGFQDDT